MTQVKPTEISRRGHEYGVMHFAAPSDGPIVSTISSALDINSKRVTELLELGSIYLNHRRVVSPDILTNEGDYLRVHTNPRRYDVSRIDLTKIIIEENTDFLIVNKPTGISVHASVDNSKENLLYLLMNFKKQELYITHRLDIPTEGLLVIAKTKEFQTIFNNYLLKDQVHKTYRAIVRAASVVPTGLVTHYMEPSPRAPKTVSLEFKEGWQKCVLEILESKRYNNEYFEVTIRLHTGRTHQIRAQMAALGNPIVGDTQYGSNISLSEKNDKIGLQSYLVKFPPQYSFELATSLNSILELNPL